MLRLEKGSDPAKQHSIIDSRLVGTERRIGSGQSQILKMLNNALKEANISDPEQEIDGIAYTKGPGMGAPLQVGLLILLHKLNRRSAL